MSIVALFASIGEHLPILKKEKYSAPDPEGKINALHYRATVMLILAMTLLVTSTDWISNGGLIDCLTAGTIPDNVINNYCYIMGTFSVPKHYIQEKTDVSILFFVFYITLVLIYNVYGLHSSCIACVMWAFKVLAEEHYFIARFAFVIFLSSMNLVDVFYQIFCNRK